MKITTFVEPPKPAPKPAEKVVRKVAKENNPKKNLGIDDNAKEDKEDNEE